MQCNACMYACMHVGIYVCIHAHMHACTHACLYPCMYVCYARAKAGKREIFGKMVVVKAKPAKTIVKAYCVAALKKSI